MDRMGLHRNYFMEQKLVEARPDQMLRFYNLDDHLEMSIFKNKSVQSDK